MKQTEKHVQFTILPLKLSGLQFVRLLPFGSYRFWFRRAEYEALMKLIPLATKSLRHKDAQSKEIQHFNISNLSPSADGL